MKKIRIKYKVNSFGEVKIVSVIGNSVQDCTDRITNAFSNVLDKIEVLKSELVEESWDCGIYPDTLTANDILDTFKVITDDYANNHPQKKVIGTIEPDTDGEAAPEIFIEPHNTKS